MQKNNWRYDLDGISLANGLTGTVVNYPTVASISKDRSWFKINFKPFAFNRTFIDLKCSFEYFNASKEKKTFYATLNTREESGLSSPIVSQRIYHRVPSIMMGYTSQNGWEAIL